jgi:hypothetical protein
MPLEQFLALSHSAETVDACGRDVCTSPKSRRSTVADPRAPPQLIKRHDAKFRRETANCDWAAWVRPYEDTVDRAVIIGTDIYSLAHRSVTVAGADLLDIKKIVGLPEGYGYYNTSGPGIPLAMTQ